MVVNPTGNPSSKGYYELTGTDEAVANYVSSHLSLTNAGLWVINDNSSYKILLSSTGMKVYDAQGVPVATFGENISFSATRQQYIGSETAYIIFDPITNTINIGGSGIRFDGEKTLSELLDELNSVTLTIETTYNVNNIVFIAHLMQAGKYLTIGSGAYPGTDFEWFKKTPLGIEFLGNGTSCTITKSSISYGETVYCTWTRRRYEYLLNNSGNNLVTNAGNKLVGRTEY